MVGDENSAASAEYFDLVWFGFANRVLSNYL